jgi:hypothetical protein
MIKRDLGPFLVDYATKFPALAILGPRQTGKTTLARMTFPKHTYITLEEPSIREVATEDPRKFLQDVSNDHGVILDEVQHVPFLLSYIQTLIDEDRKPGYFILTGSHNILLNQAITQSLAGRIAFFTLLPFSIKELRQAKLLMPTLDEAVWRGSYPAIVAQNIPPTQWYPTYIQSYVERDVRQIKNIENLSTFIRFLGLCAGRTGQLLNISALANDCDINVATARGWLSILEMSYIIFLLQPHYKNFSKRLVKSPKLYFYDTGLACSLLDITSVQDFKKHYLRGGLIESFITAEFYKEFYNRARRPSVYFWRNNHGNEVDCLLEKGQILIPVEIKGSMTMSDNFFKGLQYWHELTEASPEDEYVIYGGDRNWQRSKGNVVSWQDMYTIVEKYFDE